MLRHVSTCDRLSSGKSSIYDTQLLLAILTYVSYPTGQNANKEKSVTMAYLLIRILAKLPRHKTETFAAKQIEHQ